MTHVMSDARNLTGPGGGRRQTPGSVADPHCAAAPVNDLSTFPMRKRYTSLIFRNSRSTTHNHCRSSQQAQIPCAYLVAHCSSCHHLAVAGWLEHRAAALSLDTALLEVFIGPEYYIGKALSASPWLMLSRIVRLNSISLVPQSIWPLTLF